MVVAPAAGVLDRGVRFDVIYLLQRAGSLDSPGLLEGVKQRPDHAPRSGPGTIALRFKAARAAAALAAVPDGERDVPPPIRADARGTR